MLARMRNITLVKNYLTFQSGPLERIMKLNSKAYKLYHLVFKKFKSTFSFSPSIAYISSHPGSNESHNFSTESIQNFKNSGNLPYPKTRSKNDKSEGTRFILISSSGISILRSNDIPKGFNKFKINIYVSDLIYIILNNPESKKRYRNLLERLLNLLIINISNFKEESLTLEEKEEIENICSISNDQ